MAHTRKNPFLFTDGCRGALFRVFAVMAAVSATDAYAAEFDINGMKLGMNADQVVARYQELRPEGQCSFSKWKLPEGSEWVANGRTLYNDIANPDDMEHERMQFAFTGLGSGNQLFAVRRELKLKPSQCPTTESIYAAAVQKYGQPSISDRSDTGAWAAWKFSAVDAPAEKLESPLGCIGTSDCRWSRPDCCKAPPGPRLVLLRGSRWIGGCTSDLPDRPLGLP